VSHNFDAVVTEIASNGYAHVDMGASSERPLLESLSRAFNCRLTVQADERVSSLQAPRFRHSLTLEYGVGEFPLHTDRAHDRIPPRFVFLSQEGPLSGTLTRVISVREMPLSERDLSTLRREIWKVRYGTRPFLTAVLNDTLIRGEEILRWDPVCMVPDTKSESASIVAEAELATASAEFQLKPDWILIIDNWRCLHGRSAIVNPSVERTIRRALVYAS
jgi:Taurine catabolism dioxygenase TauD, TfdA family